MTAFVLMPAEPTDEMVDAALLETSAWRNIQGSKLTVNREKARLRYRAMVAVVAAKASAQKTCGTCSTQEEFFPAAGGDSAGLICRLPSLSLPLCMRGAAERERRVVYANETGCPFWSAKS